MAQAGFQLVFRPRPIVWARVQAPEGIDLDLPGGVAKARRLLTDRDDAHAVARSLLRKLRGLKLRLCWVQFVEARPEGLVYVATYGRGAPGGGKGATPEVEIKIILPPALAMPL